MESPEHGRGAGRHGFSGTGKRGGEQELILWIDGPCSSTFDSGDWLQSSSLHGCAFDENLQPPRSEPRDCQFAPENLLKNQTPTFCSSSACVRTTPNARPANSVT